MHSITYSHEFTLLHCKVFLITSRDTEYYKNEADIGGL